MIYLLDTCIISETRLKAPNRGVINWLSHQEADMLYLSAITIGEITNGIARLGATKKAKELIGWLDELQRSFDGRILSIDAKVAECWGRLLSENERVGKPRPAIDALICATAKVYNLTLVTRNVKDMEGMGVKIFNPFDEE